MFTQKIPSGIVLWTRAFILKNFLKNFSVESNTGGPKEIRTPNLLVANEARYRYAIGPYSESLPLLDLLIVKFA